MKKKERKKEKIAVKVMEKNFMYGVVGWNGRCREYICGKRKPYTTVRDSLKRHRLRMLKGRENRRLFLSFDWRLSRRDVVLLRVRVACGCPWLD